MSKPRIVIPAVTFALLAGVASPAIQSSLDPAGIQAHRINNIWWLFFWISAVIWVLVVVAALLTLRGRSKYLDAALAPILHFSDEQEKRPARVVSILVAITGVILFVLLITEFMTARKIYAIPDPNPLQVRVTGKRWWWNFEYQDPVTSNVVSSANELHLPVGKAVVFDLVSNDVIHSFWIPNLHGKKDLIPGHPTTTWLRADREGSYRGQCAEFCGPQHAHMRFTVTAESPDKFNAWLNAQRTTPAPPATDSEKRGKQVFMSTTCIMCHNIAGTDARATVGPDLTHIASRPTIGAGTLPNNRGNLAAWVVDPQHIKPGIIMPPNPIQPDDFQALIDYLETLK